MYEKEIAAGIRYIEAEGITDWRERLADVTLIMVSGYSCVVGHLFGEFSTYLDRKGLSKDWAREHGFLLASGALWDAYDRLENEWRAAIHGDKPTPELVNA